MAATSTNPFPTIALNTSTLFNSAGWYYLYDACERGHPSPSHFQLPGTFNNPMAARTSVTPQSQLSMGASSFCLQLCIPSYVHPASPLVARARSCTATTRSCSPIQQDWRRGTVTCGVERGRKRWSVNEVSMIPWSADIPKGEGNGIRHVPVSFVVLSTRANL